MSERPVYVVEDGLVRLGDAEVLLIPRERGVLDLLLRLYPHFVTVDRIASHIWPAQMPASARNMVHRLAGPLRRKLAAVGVEVEARNYHGYRLKAPLAVEHVTERDGI